MKKVLLFAMLLFASVVIAADKYDKWVDEEVKPIITKAERDQFKKLKSEADKEKFVTDFWARRDPTPGTPDNEYRKNYEEQLKIVVEKMKASRKKPVDTDMGQAVLILGGGYEVKQGEAEEEGPPSQTWIYHSLPPGLAKGEVTIAFEGDPSEGGFKFTDPKSAHAILDTAREYYAHLSEKASSMKEEEKAKMEAAMAAAEAMPEITTAAVKTALDAAAAGTMSNDVTFSVLADSFMSSGGDVFATFAGYSPSDVSAARVGVRVTKEDGTLVKQGEYAFSTPLEAPGHFQAGTPIKPGNYNVYFAIVSGDKTGTAKATLYVPDYSAGFNMSSLILAKAYKQLDTASPEKEPYTFGKIKVEPSVDRVFTKADEVIVVYEAYNFDMPAGATSPTMEVSFTFQRGTDPAKSTPPTPPNGLVTGKKITIPTSYPLAKFPEGVYKLTVKLTDKSSGKATSREATFTVK